MKQSLIAMLLILLSGCTTIYREPNEFIAKHVGIKNRLVTWRVVDDAVEECKRLGTETGALACAIMGEHNCVIITSKNTSHEILGHETRHCFEGNFH